MGISVTKIREKYNDPNHKEFLLDTDGDMESLPGLNICAPGSEAYSIESGKKFILNNIGEWTEKLGV